MKRCSKCQEPMITAGDVCGRCAPSPSCLKALDKAIDPPKGGKGHHNWEIQLDLRKISETHVMATPDVAWMGADVASVFDDLCQGRITTEEKKPRFWPNAEDTHVNQRSAVQDGGRGTPRLNAGSFKHALKDGPHADDIR